MKISKSLLSVGLFLGATSAAALSLGEVRGSVVLGRPLDVMFDVQPDPGVALDAACLTATATVGDTLIDNSRMQISVVPAVAGRATAVRVRSRALINEPIVSVQLSAGCSGVVSRTYHLFADPPAALPAAAVLPVLPSARRPTPEAVAASGAAPRADTATTLPRRAQPAPPRMAAARSERTAPVVKGPREAPPRRRPAPPAERAVTAPTSRLVIEPLEDWLLLPPTLRLSSDLQALPSQEPSPERAQAAAQWKALNLSVGDSAEQAERALALSAQAEAERATAAKAQSTVSALQQRLDRLEAERFSPALVYALLALLAATLAGWVWYALRTRRHIAAATADWSDAVSESAARQAEREGPASRQARASGNAGLLDKDLELFLQEDGQAQRSTAASSVVPTPAVVIAPPVAAIPVRVSAPAPTSAPAHAAPLVPVSPVMPAVHVVQPEEFFDVQQQAEFFVSVGEHDQAIEVMSKHIAQNHAASPWAYLELLRLYRSLSRVGPFNQLRAQFQQHFNAEVPEFSAFHQVNRGLLDYPEVLARIEALWSDDAVGPLLEGLLFCRDGAARMERFDLCAYDDLLMLYAIARTTPASTRGAPPPRQRTTPAGAAELPASLAPPDPLELENFDSLTLSEAPAPTAAAVDNMIEYDLMLPGQSEPAVLAPLDMTLDIDLSEPDWKDSLRLPALTVSDMPAVPVTAAPAPGQAVGFGANSDRVEARFDLEERKPDAP